MPELLSSDLELLVSGEEREFLIALLRHKLQETRVEEHRTRAPEYRQHILHREDLMASILARLEPPPAAG